MNEVLELRGKRFINASKNVQGGGAAINSRSVVTSVNLQRLISKLQQIKDFWQKEKKLFDGILISVHYNKIVAKSNRISGIFKGDQSNSAIVGAKFDEKKTKHIITYFLSIDDLDYTEHLLSCADAIVRVDFGGEVTKEKFIDSSLFNHIIQGVHGISKSLFQQIIADISYIEDFEIEKAPIILDECIITLYDTKTDTRKLLEKIGINVISSRILNNHTVYLDKNQAQILFEKAPYLVSMATENLLDLSPDTFGESYRKNIYTIPEPTIEPTIGVIDTLFDTRVYFGKWVEYHDMLDDSIPKTTNDYIHGTCVSSLIVDGPSLNPELDDGCGRFKVRHFGVATESKFSSFSIIRLIKKIIAENQDIKVWNLSLGSPKEINDNFISAEAAILDQIQYENDVIFVIAGTNKTSESVVKIGSPADSINSIVVNAVTSKGLSPQYARKGLALSFYAKPDISYFGGSQDKYIVACGPLGGFNVAGTSYAAPLIARKLSYLIDILGLNREIAKAMLIDSARSWNVAPTPEEVAIYGHGTVPIKIDDIIKSKDDEIRFLVSDVSDKWNTYCYDFPVPLQNNSYPYVVRATMCYFPECNRSQGVDYTNTELNLHFGRIKDDGKLNEINGDKQNSELSTDGEKSFILEGDARSKFRKWDNVKYISESIAGKKKPKKAYEKNKNWGMEIKTNNRLSSQDGRGLRFGVVVTLKEINGVNRIDDFIRNCHLNGWLVNKIDVEHRVDIHSKINEEFELF
ncbi:MAG: S8 family peptidase [Lentisphaerae bacterium]|nr:S8 family peptidase [Lentisphaerota bacterium]